MAISKTLPLTNFHSKYLPPVGKATAKALNEMGVNLILSGRDEKKTKQT